MTNPETKTDCDAYQPCRGNYACCAHASVTPGTVEHAIANRNPSFFDVQSNPLVRIVRKIEYINRTTGQHDGDSAVVVDLSSVSSWVGVGTGYCETVDWSDVWGDVPYAQHDGESLATMIAHSDPYNCGWASDERTAYLALDTAAWALRTYALADSAEVDFSGV